MSIIYKPKGKAREYSPLAANFYNGCDHGCIYCYAPGIKKITREQYLSVSPRRDILHEIEKDCKKYAYSKSRYCLILWEILIAWQIMNLRLRAVH